MVPTDALAMAGTSARKSTFPLSLRSNTSVADVVGTEAFEQWITARHRDSMLSAYERRVLLDQLLRPWQHLPIPPAIADLAARARALL
jgi:hypothetical protein